MKVLLTLITAILIIQADAIIKLASNGKTYLQAIQSPLMWLVYALYLVQISVAVQLFTNAAFSIYTNIFIVFYGILGVVVGCVWFKEAISTQQYVGIALGLAGAWLMSK